MHISSHAAGWTSRLDVFKKSIWCRRLLSRRPKNTFTDVASTSSWDRLFQRLITRCEKNWRRASQWQWLFNSFQLWPLVAVFSDLWKKSFYGVPEKPLTNLKSSMRSVLLCLSCRDHRPSWRSLSSYGKLRNSGNKRVKRCWTRWYMLRIKFGLLTTIIIVLALLNIWRNCGLFSIS